MNVFDAGVVVLVVVAVILGSRSGALPQLGGLFGAIAGAALAILSLPLLADILVALEPAPRALVVLGWLLGSVGVGEAVGSTAGRVVARGLGTGLFGAMDRVAGGFVGAAQALLIAWLAGGLLAAGPIPRLASQAQSSTSVRALATVLPPPTEFAAGLGRLLGGTGLPDVFVGLEPVPAPPVDRPSDPRARAIGRLAEPSTVKVSAQTCGLVSTGTGFVAGAPEYVVTNAHVVAGATNVKVSLAGRLYDATPVLFDPSLDIAVLWAPRLDAPALRFATAGPGRGTQGAALGFPGGGPLTVVPAAVAQTHEATGRDIYGEARVTRSILELRATIERGDSGGPFVLEDGSVGGVVFAEARSDEDVGYALAPVPVSVAIRPAVGRTGAADTGSCIR